MPNFITEAEIQEKYNFLNSGYIILLNNKFNEEKVKTRGLKKY